MKGGLIRSAPVGRLSWFSDAQKERKVSCNTDGESTRFDLVFFMFAVCFYYMIQFCSVWVVPFGKLSRDEEIYPQVNKRKKNTSYIFFLFKFKTLNMAPTEVKKRVNDFIKHLKKGMFVSDASGPGSWTVHPWSEGSSFNSLFKRWWPDEG